MNSECLNDINSTIIVYGNIISHDPVDPWITYDEERGVYKAPDRHSMMFVKPIISKYFRWSYLINDYEIVEMQQSLCYHRPSEFYDHVLTPNEVKNLSDAQLKRYLEHFCDRCSQFEKRMLFKFMETRADVMKIYQANIDPKCYDIISEITCNENYRKGHITFDESWNTIFYYQLLPPRRHMHFLNIRKCTCTCNNYKIKKYCIHTHKICLYRILFNNLKSNIGDFYNLIKHELEP